MVLYYFSPQQQARAHAQIIVVSGVDEQPMTGTRKEKAKEDEKQTQKPKYLQRLSKGSISVELIGHAWPILRSIAKQG